MEIKEFEDICPYIKGNEVGSYECSICPYFRDYNLGEITCSYKKEHQDEAHIS